MSERLLVEGFRPTKSGEDGRRISRDSMSGQFLPVPGRSVSAASGPSRAEKLPKTTSSVHVPKK